MNHARLAPSSAERIVLCNGSAKMEALFPQDDTVESREGDAVHWAGAGLALGGVHDIGEVAPNGVVLNVEMLEAAELWRDIVWRHGLPGSIETTITTPILHAYNWGTPDHWFYDHMTRTLYVDDLKYGHRFISVRENWQIMNYAALILNSLGLFWDDSIHVSFTIVQPRSYHRLGPVRSWATTVAEMRPHWNTLSLAFARALGDDVMVTPHLDACRDCKARWDCEGNLAATYIGVDMSYQSEPLEMSPAALSREYRLLLQAEGFIKARREGIAQRTMQTIRRQQSVPHFALERKPGRRVWVDDAVQNGIIDICATHGVDAAALTVGLTPLQAIKAGVPEHVVKLFSRINSGALELVEDDGSAAAAIFNQPKE